MDVNNIASKDGDPIRPSVVEAPSIIDGSKCSEVIVKKKRRRGKSKRKVTKPFVKVQWPERRINEKSKRNNRFRNIVLTKTQAPFNNNQFLMEIHKPEPENNYHILRTPSARTRDSSFSVDSEDNYFYSLPEDEEEYLTKEFSSVYEDAQCERLSSMSKNDLIQEYLLLEAKYDNLIKRTERVRPKLAEDEKDMIEVDKDGSTTDKDSMITDKDTSGTSIGSCAVDEPSLNDLLKRMKEQEDQICELQLANEKLRIENEHLQQRSRGSSSEDSESDSSSTSDSDSSSCRSASPVIEQIAEISENNENCQQTNGQNEETEESESIPMVNGFHNICD